MKLLWSTIATLSIVASNLLQVRGKEEGIGGGGAGSTPGGIVGGTPTSSADYPGFVVSKTVGDKGIEFGVGGYLIHPDIVLTYGLEALWSVGGTVYIGGTQRDGSDAVETRIIESTVRHPDGILMLVKLIAPSAQPVDVVGALNTDNAIPAMGDSLRMVGFASDILMEATVARVAGSACSPNFDAKTEFFCAGDPTTTICYFDFGCPIFNNGSGVVVGVAYGPSVWFCGGPGRFVRVAVYHDWIQTNICHRSNNPPPNCTEWCGDGTCNSPYEDCTFCPQDCGKCICGDGECSHPDEDCASCPDDCKECCGDGTCRNLDEDCVSCPQDCGECICGDGTCNNPVEDCASCPEDCGDCCGDGTCNNPDEDCTSCPQDCGECKAPQCNFFTLLFQLLFGWLLFLLGADPICTI